MAKNRKRTVRPNIRTYRLKQNVSGIVQNREEVHLRPDQAKDIINMHSTKEGAWSSHNVGYTVINDSATAYESGASVDGLVWYSDSNGTDHLFVAINGKIKEINTGTGVASDIDASAGLTAGEAASFVGMNDNLFTADGTIDAPRKWDGTTASAASGWPISDGSNTYKKPKYLLLHQNRLLALNFQEGTGATTSYPSHFALSDLDDPETFTTGSANATDSFIGEVESGDGQVIVGGASIHIPRTNESQAIIFKERSTFVVLGASGKSSDADAFSVIKMNGNYGAFNNRSIVQVGNDILALNEYGITSYSSSTSSGSVQPSAINSDTVIDVIGRINLNAKDKCWGIHLPSRREVIFFVPTGANTQCNEAIVYKYPSPADQGALPKWSRRTDASSKFKISHGCLVNKTFYIGTYSGFVGTMFTSSKYDDVGVPWTYEFPFLDFGNEKQNKRVLNMDILGNIRSNMNINLLSRWRGGGSNESVSQTVTLETTVGGAVYGTAIYGTSTYGSRDDIRQRVETLGDGLKVKYKLSGTNGSSGFDFFGLLPVVERGNISQHWN